MSCESEGLFDYRFATSPFVFSSYVEELLKEGDYCASKYSSISFLLVLFGPYERKSLLFIWLSNSDL